VDGRDKPGHDGLVAHKPLSLGKPARPSRDEFRDQNRRDQQPIATAIGLSL
jgi:hypothetical protein